MTELHDYMVFVEGEGFQAFAGLISVASPTPESIRFLGIGDLFLRDVVMSGDTESTPVYVGTEKVVAELKDMGLLN